MQLIIVSLITIKSKIMKGSIPKNEIIKLCSNKEQWLLFAKGLINEFMTEALIKRSETSTVKIKIDFTFVSSPELCHSKSIAVLDYSAGVTKDNAEGIRRAHEFFTNYVDKRMWVIGGFIQGQTRIPIILLYYEIFDICVYSVKFSDEDVSDFFPAGFPTDARLN